MLMLFPTYNILMTFQMLDEQKILILLFGQSFDQRGTKINHKLVKM